MPVVKTKNYKKVSKCSKYSKTIMRGGASAFSHSTHSNRSVARDYNFKDDTAQAINNIKTEKLYTKQSIDGTSRILFNKIWDLYIKHDRYSVFNDVIIKALRQFNNAGQSLAYVLSRHACDDIIDLLLFTSSDEILYMENKTKDCSIPIVGWIYEHTFSDIDKNIYKDATYNIYTDRRKDIITRFIAHRPYVWRFRNSNNESGKILYDKYIENYKQ